MCGFFPQAVAMTCKRQNFGYVEVNLTRHNMLGPEEGRIRAHEFHHSRLESNEEDHCIKMRKNATRSWTGGLSRKKVLAAYPHLHFQANPTMAENFIAECLKFGSKSDFAPYLALALRSKLLNNMADRIKEFMSAKSGQNKSGLGLFCSLPLFWSPFLPIF